MPKRQRDSAPLAGELWAKDIHGISELASLTPTQRSQALPREYVSKATAVLDAVRLLQDDRESFELLQQEDDEFYVVEPTWYFVTRLSQYPSALPNSGYRLDNGQLHGEWSRDLAQEGDHS